MVFLQSFQGNGNGLKDFAYRVGGEHYAAPICENWIERKNIQYEIYLSIKSSDIVFIWNRFEYCSQWFINICEQLNKPYLFMETGFLPQKDHYHLDTGGIIKQSSLNKDLSWLTEEQMQSAKDYIKNFIKINNYHRSQDIKDFILCPLQLESDTSVYLSSKYSTMNEFIYDVRKNNPNENILISPHPKNPKPNISIIDGKMLLIKNKEIKTVNAAKIAKKAIGINSTSLYEMLAINCPIEAYGECPLKNHNYSKNVLYAAITQQFHKHDITRFNQITKFLIERKSNIGY